MWMCKKIKTEEAVVAVVTIVLAMRVIVIITEAPVRVTVMRM